MNEPKSVQSFRFDGDLLQAGMEKSGLSKSEYIERALINQLRRDGILTRGGKQTNGTAAKS